MITARLVMRVLLGLSTAYLATVITLCCALTLCCTQIRCSTPSPPTPPPPAEHALTLEQIEQISRGWAAIQALLWLIGTVLKAMFPILNG